MSGQYNDVRGDFQYKLTRDQGTPANADADRHLFVIFAPQPGYSALFIIFFITLGRKRYQISLLMRIIQSPPFMTRWSGSMTSKRVISEARYRFCRQGELA